MRIVVTGSSGLVGSALISSLAAGGHTLVRLLRTAPAGGANTSTWDPAGGTIDAAAIEACDAAVHLAGAGIGDRRWSDAYKAEIHASRSRGTRLISETLAKLERPPRVLVAASAIGYYGDRGEEVLSEESAPGQGFLPELCRDWEAATQPAQAAGVRVVNVRFGVVLSSAGGALRRMLTPFRMGVAGRIGNGRQFMSWIAIDDAVGVIEHAIATDTLRGPVNAVAPQPVTNYEFTKTLGRVLLRPTIFPMPAFAARLAFGEMANDLLLASTRVEPRRLMESGYTFRQPELEAALRHLLAR